METKSLKEEIFTVDVNNKQYFIEPICENDYCLRFKIFSNRGYMFTLCIDENGHWQMEDDVTPMNRNLIKEIGKAIEYYETR